MRKNPEQLAWTILLISFFLCLGVAVLAPLGVRWYTLNARVVQYVTLEVQRPPLRVTEPGRNQPVSVAEDPDDAIVERTTIATYASSGRLVMRVPRESGPVITTVQLYNDTEIELSLARSPRFLSSRLPHEVALEIKSGRVRINVFGDDGGDTVVNIETPQGTATLVEGDYEVKVGNTTEITVRQGRAEVTGLGAPLSQDERAIIEEGQVAGPLAAAPNLISNGDFQLPLEDSWIGYTEQEEDPPGSVDITTSERQEVASFSRSGSNHAEVGIRQGIDYPVHDLASLELHLIVQIKDQSIPVCGTLGSECPIMVRIVYEDANGAEQEWLQGFYTMPNTGASDNPAVCTTCNTKNPHIQVRKDTWYPYLSANLIPPLSQDGQAPTVIKSIIIYASGHAYYAMVTEVELIGYE